MKYGDPNTNRRKRLARMDRQISRCPQCGEWMWKRVCPVDDSLAKQAQIRTETFPRVTVC